MALLIHITVRNLLRRPLRTLFSLVGLSLSLAVLATLTGFSQRYEQGLRGEIGRMGMQMMLVPLGCPYDASAIILKGRALDTSLPQNALEHVVADPDVAAAAPVLTAAIPRREIGRTDLWMGIDENIRLLKPWWRMGRESRWFRGPNSIILGADAAADEMRRPGDHFFSPETGREFVVSGVLERSGTSDDSQFFVPLATAQAMFRKPGRLTGIEIRLKDPAQVGAVAARMQQIPGGQVVTLTEMMGVFLTLLGSARKLILAIALLSFTVGALSAFNTMLAAALERSREMSVLRAIGMSRPTAFALMIFESVMLALIGGAIGCALAIAGDPVLESAVQPMVPFAPAAVGATTTALDAELCFGVALGVGLIAGVYPAWCACRRAPALAFRAEG